MDESQEMGDNIGFTKGLADGRVARLCPYVTNQHPELTSFSAVGLLDLLGLLAGWAANRNCTGYGRVTHVAHASDPRKLAARIGTSQEERGMGRKDGRKTVRLKLKKMEWCVAGACPAALQRTRARTNQTLLGLIV